MRICTILGKGYEEIEAIGTLALLKRSGLEAHQRRKDDGQA